MATVGVFNGDIYVGGNIQLGGSLLPGVSRSSLTQDAQQSYAIPWTFFRKHDAYDTNLSSTPATSYLGLIGGTFGTGVPSLQTGDLKNAGATTRYARCTFQLPPEYVSGQAVSIRLHAGMLTTVASASATVNVEVYKSNKETLVSGGNLYTGPAVTINSTSLTDKDFALAASGLTAGDELDIRIAIAVNDSATVTAVIGCIGRAEVLLSIKG